MLLLAGLGAALLFAGWQPASGDQLLVNGGFEVGTTGWDAPNGEFTTVSSPVHGGSASGRLADDFPVTQLVGQWVNVGPGQTYEFNGWVLLNDPSIDKVFLRIRWYDAGGSPLFAVDSPWLTSPDSSFRSMSTGPQVAPPQAHRAWLNVLVQPDGPFELYLDDFSFQGPPPPPPSPTPTPTATPTATPPPQPNTAPTSSPTPRPPGPVAEAAAEPAVFPSLVNGGFEDVRDDGTPYGWRKIGGEMSTTAAVSAEGDRSAALVSRTESTKWLYQTVSVQGGSYYRLQAKALKNDPGVRETLLRVSWYRSADGSGRQISTADSEALAGDSRTFASLDTGPVQAPPEARSAKVRLLLRPASAANAVVYFDDVRFEAAAPPPNQGAAIKDEQLSTSSGTEGRRSGQGADAQPGTPTGEVLSSRSGPAIPANVKAERDRQDLPAASSGRPLWPILLAIGVPAAGLTAMAGSAWWKNRLAARDQPHE